MAGGPGADREIRSNYTPEFRDLDESRYPPSGGPRELARAAPKQEKKPRMRQTWSHPARKARREVPSRWLTRRMPF